MTNEEMYELHGLLHTLWTKSGTTFYDKKQWQRLETLIGKAILTILGSKCKNGAYMTVISPKKS